MKYARLSRWRIVLLLAGTLSLPGAPRIASAEAKPQAIAAFDAYVAKVQARLADELRSAAHFLSPVDPTALRSGRPVIEQLTPSVGASLPGALLHDWRGTAFIPGATAADFVQLMTRFGAWPRDFAPQVLSTSVLRRNGDHYRVLMRMRQHHIITVTLDETVDIDMEPLSPRRGYSFSRSTHIDEVASDGHHLSPNQEHGFLWRLDTWWTWQERDGGLEVQIESVSLSRSIPTGLGWVVKPYVRSIPRKSLAFTLDSVCTALSQDTASQGE
jgi:hypothetical protein